MTSHTMRYWAYAIAAVFCLSFSYDLIRIPVQVPDSLDDIQESLTESSVAATFMSELHRPAFLRPLNAAQIRFVFDVSRGRHTFGYRGVHVLLFLLTMWMFVRALQVRTATDLAAAFFALTVLLGSNTFGNLLREAYPINHFLEVMLFGLIVLNLAQGPGGWAADVAAALMFAAGALVVESGLLIWVVIVAAYLGGLRGISRRGVIVTTLLLCGYVYLRVFVLSTNVPAVGERSSGFFLRVLEVDELRELFGQHPLPFYAYNVIASAMSVLLSEPRAGLMVATSAYLTGEVQPWMVVAVVSSLITTVLVLVASAASLRDGAVRDGPERLYVIFAVVLVANAALSYAYLKDDIVSFAGAFYALAAYAAVRWLIGVGALTGRIAATVFSVVLLVASSCWAIRTAGLHYNLRYVAFKTQNEWAVAPERWTQTPEMRAVTERLRRDALEYRTVAPRFYQKWHSRWFEE